MSKIVKRLIDNVVVVEGEFYTMPSRVTVQLKAPNHHIICHQLHLKNMDVDSGTLCRITFVRNKVTHICLSIDLNVHTFLLEKPQQKSGAICKRKEAKSRIHEGK